MSSAAFDDAMYERIRPGCQDSAALVVAALSRRIRPGRVIDVGGGEGWWASEFAKQGAEATVMELEAPRVRAPYVNFITGVDLTQPLEPWPPDVRYDLAVCLEVAEHLPAAAAPVLVETLTRLAPLVLFSAAIPSQGGHGHLNEQWPVYWHRLFQENGMGLEDEIRWRIWDDTRIEPWYRQNLMLARPLATMDDPPPAVVHPDIYQWKL